MDGDLRDLGEIDRLIRAYLAAHRDEQRTASDLTFDLNEYSETAVARILEELRPGMPIEWAESFVDSQEE